MQILNRIRLACQKRGITKLYAVSDFNLEEQEKEWLKNAAGKLKDWKIDMAAAENVSSDPAVWDRLTETGTVLMVCKTGTTTHQMIDDAMSFYLENGIHVLGSAVFFQN